MRNIYAQFNKDNPSWEDFLARAIHWSFTIWNGKNKFLSKKAGWCEICHMGKKKLIAHHINPIKAKADYLSWDEYIAAVFTTNLQALCNNCHSQLYNPKKKVEL
jgi:hypothetical protein